MPRPAARNCQTPTFGVVMVRIRGLPLPLALLVVLMLGTASCKEQAGQPKKQSQGRGEDATIQTPQPSPGSKAKSKRKDTGDDEGEDDEGDGDNGSDDDAVDAGKLWLKLGTLTPPDRLVTRTTDEIKTEIDADRSFFNNAPADDEAEAETCFSKTIAKHKIEAKRDRIAIAFDADFKTCFKAELTAAGEDITATVEEARMKLVIWYECPGVDLRQWDGKPADALMNSDSPCLKATEDVKHALNMRYVAKATYKVAGETRTFDVDMKYAAVNPNDGACVARYESGVFTHDDCVSVVRTVDKSTGSAGSTYARQEAQSLKAKAADKYYRSGKTNIEIDGWKGEMTYSGATTAPKYSMTKGTQRAAGTFSYKQKDEALSLHSASAPGFPGAPVARKDAIHRLLGRF